MTNDDAVIAVSDQGVGIPPEEAHRVFEPFRRAGSARQLAPGLGLGLFLARRIVEAHGGAIELESRSGSGSTFRIRLPLGSPRKVECAYESLSLS